MGQHYKLSVNQRPRTEAEASEMQQIRYANLIGHYVCYDQHKAGNSPSNFCYQQIHSESWEGALVSLEVVDEIHEGSQ